MELKDKTGYHQIPSEEHNMKESPIYNDEDGEKEDKKEKEKKKKKKKKEKKGKKNTRRHRKIFWVCCSDVSIGSRVLFQDENKKKREELDEGGFKVKEEGFLFSNVEIEPKEDVEKVQELVEKMNKKKSCFLVCCSDIQVAP